MKRSNTKFIAKADCDCGKIRIKAFGDKVLVICPCKPPRTLDDSGVYKELEGIV